MLYAAQICNLQSNPLGLFFSPLAETMTEVIFVEVTASRMEIRACEIAEDNYVQGRKLQITAYDLEQAERLDDLLWTFKPDSFLPHALLIGSLDESPHPVVITTSKEAVKGMDSLLMMGYSEVDLVSQFSRAIHLVVTDNQDRLDNSRRYWTLLKDAGFSLRHQNR